MTDESVKDQLRRWGSAYQAYLAVVLDGPGVATHVLEKARTLAPGTRERAAKRLIGRDGRARRRMMAKAATIGGLHSVPMWACEPVRGRNDASPPRDLHAVITPAIPDDLRWIDRALSAMARQCPLREAIVREEYTGGGTQRMKARSIELRYGGTLSIDQYKRELRRGIEYLELMIAVAA